MTKRNLIEKTDPRERLEHVKQWRLDNEAALDFDELRRQFDWLKFSLTAVVLPPVGVMSALLAARSANRKLKNESRLWDYYDHPENEGYRRRTEEFNADLEISGLPALVSGMPPDEGAWATIVERGIERRRISTSFLEAWAQLRVLAWRHAVIMAAQEDIQEKFEKQMRDAAAQATTAQHVWYARWVLHNAANFDDDRPEAEHRFVKMCAAIASDRRVSPDKKRWSSQWFGKLLRTERTPNGQEKRLLLERLSRLSENQVRRLANEQIPDYLLPPLTLQ